MNDELPTILQAIRAAQAELAAYLNSADRNAELTIAKLVGILERREVVRAMRLLHPRDRAAIVPQSTLAKGELIWSPSNAQVQREVWRPRQRPLWRGSTSERRGRAARCPKWWQS